MGELLSPIKIRMMKADLEEINAHLEGSNDGYFTHNREAIEDADELRKKKRHLEKILGNCSPERLKGVKIDKAYNRIKEIDGLISDAMKQYGVSNDGLQKEHNARYVEQYEKAVKLLWKERRDLMLLVDPEHEQPGLVEHLRKNNYGTMYEK